MNSIATVVAAVILLSIVTVTQAQTTPAPAPTSQPTETPEQRDVRMKWWREARFGMFIHWGIYSVPAGTYQGKQINGIGEWIMNRGKIPVAEYAKYAAQFNPVLFDADAWVRTAKEAGMKYIVITSKHHDGFAMFDTHVSDYGIVTATPFRRDPLRELAEACRKHGIHLGFYYSQAQDWHHTGGAGNTWDPSHDGSMDDYIDKIAVPQVREILSNYPIEILWWDTPRDMTKERAEKFLPLLALKPGIITNNRLGAGFKGDTETPEQYVPPTGYPGRDWETCMTMNDTWGYKSYDQNWKSTETLLRNLIDIASKGGNYLLNVGPTARGEIPGPSIERLGQIGKWLKHNGEAIYGTSASPFKRYSFDGRATVKGNRLYLHVFDWPENGIEIVGLKTPVKYANFLFDGSAATLDKGESAETGTATVIIKPPANKDPIATVVSLELEGPPEVDATAIAIRPDAKGLFRLAAGDADHLGEKLQMDETHHGLSADKSDHGMWNVTVPKAGIYQVEIEYGCEDKSAGSSYAVVAGDEKVSGKVAGTGGWKKFKAEKVGELKLGEGRQTIRLEASEITDRAAMNLREIRIKP